MKMRAIACVLAHAIIAGRYAGVGAKMSAASVRKQGKPMNEQRCIKGTEWN